MTEDIKCAGLTSGWDVKKSILESYLAGKANKPIQIIPNPDDPVSFRVDLLDGVDGYEVKSALEQLSSDVSVQVIELQMLGRQLVGGKTDQTTYESLFNAKLAYVERTIQNINRGPYQVQEWQEVKTAEVPDGLQHLVKRISLEQNVYLTD